jgi:protein gp37
MVTWSDKNHDGRATIRSIVRFARVCKGVLSYIWQSRPPQEAWVTDIRDQCLSANVPFFFKQWGGVFKSRNGRTLEGRT